MVNCYLSSNSGPAWVNFTGIVRVAAAVRREVEDTEFIHLVDNRLDNDMIVFQDRTLRFTIPASLVLDDVEFG